MTLRQPEERSKKQIPDGHLYPMTLPLTEALESLKIILASFIKPKRTQLPLLSSIEITPRNSRLVYVPFQEKYLEIIQPEYQLTINKNQLALAGNL